MRGFCSFIKNNLKIFIKNCNLIKISLYICQNIKQIEIMENLDLFTRAINEQIERVRNMQNVQFEIGVLEDLKRMAAIGCFSVITAQPNDFELKFSKDNGLKLEMNCLVPRMVWTGEKTITYLESKNKELVEFLQRIIVDRDMFTDYINEAQELINKNK